MAVAAHQPPLAAVIGGAGDGTAPIPGLAVARPAIEAAGVAPRPAVHEQILAVLEDDRMTCAEIHRQLARTDVTIGDAALRLALCAMTYNGLLTERTILDRDCWSAA